MDELSCEVHHTERVEVTAVTIRYFMTNYLGKNGCIIEIIGSLYVNESVQFFVLFDQAWVSGLPFICNLLDCVEATGWGVGNYPKQELVGGINDTNSNKNVAWGASIKLCPAYLPRSPFNPCAARILVCNNIIYQGCQ